jgi:hypothetical protein
LPFFLNDLSKISWWRFQSSEGLTMFDS